MWGLRLERECASSLELPPEAQIVLGVGYADMRKGFDIFLEVAERIGCRKQTLFVWLGHQDESLLPKLKPRMTKLINNGKLALPGLVSNTDEYYAAADLYLLTSREDPYPSTVLEALDVGVPVIGFHNVTGVAKLIVENGGRLVPEFDVLALWSMKACRLLERASSEDRLQRATNFWLRPDVPFPAYVHDLLDILKIGPKRVSVIVPNYNYARFLPDRIESILQQKYPIAELIILDDASTDDSLAEIGSQLARIDVPTKVITNSQNSGSVFVQWLKGAEAATSDYLWIAEADDSSDPNFLGEVMRGFEYDHVVLSYCQSQQLGQDGSILCDHYLEYVEDVSPTQWTADYVRSGLEEIEHGLTVKNTIPNVSAVVFRRTDIVETIRAHLDEILEYRVAGDWCTYVHLLLRGSCAFSAKSLNKHRRHAESVTIKQFSWLELREIIQMQKRASQLVGQSSPHPKAENYVSALTTRLGDSTTTLVDQVRAE